MIGTGSFIGDGARLPELEAGRISARKNSRTQRPIWDSLRKEFARRLPFRTELMVCPGREVLDLVAEDPFAGEASHPDLRFFVSVTAKPPRRPPALPLEKPEGKAWLVRLVGQQGRLFYGCWRRGPGAFPDPNTLVEKHVGMPATSRNWNTFVKLARILGRLPN